MSSQPTAQAKKISVEDSISRPVCPKCSSEFVKRASRVGFERLMSVFYIYPFRCEPCGHRFRIMQWRVTYTRIQLEEAAARKRHPKEPRDERAVLHLK